VKGSKQVFHWTSETWWEWSEIAGSPQGSPPAADSVGCEAGMGTCSENETGTEELCDPVHPGLHIVGTEPSEAPTEGRWSQLSESRRDHQCSETTPTGESRFHTSTPLRI
jgi:hypothetical protein